MQRGFSFNHNEICDFVREKTLFEISNRIDMDSLQVSFSFYNNEMTAIVTHADGISHLNLKGDNKK